MISSRNLFFRFFYIKNIAWYSQFVAFAIGRYYCLFICRLHAVFRIKCFFHHDLDAFMVINFICKCRKVNKTWNDIHKIESSIQAFNPSFSHNTYNARITLCNYLLFKLLCENLTNLNKIVECCSCLKL